MELKMASAGVVIQEFHFFLGLVDYHVASDKIAGGGGYECIIYEKIKYIESYI